VTGSLIVFMIATLSVIYLSSYHEIGVQNEEMLRRYADSCWRGEKFGQDGKESAFDPGDPFPHDAFSGFDPGGFPGGKDGRDDKKPPFKNESAFLASTFYSVIFSGDGTVASVDSSKSELTSEEELVDAAKSVLERGEDSGKSGNLIYTVDRRGEYTLVAFIDISVTDNSMSTLLRQILIFGGASIVVLFIISIFLARMIVKPLEENDRRQKQFISDAGHELKTPVSVISTNTELLGRQIGENEWLSNIRYENERMGTLIKQLLDLSRTESTDIVAEHVDLSRLVTGEALPFESVAFEKGLELKSDVAEGVNVSGSPPRLRQLVSILLDNAISHTSGGTEVGLSLKQEHKKAVLSVTNPGKEIPKEKLERLFERFYRVDESRSGDESHYGLGLSIAKAITESHKGTIEVSCRGGKVVFTVALPCESNK